MLLDIVAAFPNTFFDIQEIVMARSKRYAAILERTISPEGTFPMVGCSTCYRFGAFQLLSQAALQHFIPDDISPEQVSSALATVIRRMMKSKNNFDRQGWLCREYVAYSPI